ncbi:cysteine desulfuration protein SufE [Apibacter mensalis]|jgi:cysteine desulfuration protein SufE|uniref:Cysteine desulfuration protein SufE n=1 Tax=Apibacter mensalis TaxID=1586267 RepID=A0A0X3AP42_9FLAO|nr:SufE family protein [Apibacter mensalis]CVK16121.1 cysteine desulfuration protein SufE [Apibacter mensalis]
MTISEIQQGLINEFSLFDSWEQRYEYVIELGKSLPEMPEKDKIQDKLIKGCQSQVWLNTRLENGKLFFEADSDAILPKGIAAMLVHIYSGQPIEDILKSDENFIEKIGLQEFLSPTRANGLLAMIKQIKYYAIAYSAKK